MIEDDSIESLSRAINDDLGIPISYFSSSQKLYAHFNEEEDKHVSYDEKQLTRFLRAKALSGNKGTGLISEIDEYLAKCESEYRVDYIGIIDWLGSGYQEVGEQKFYNLEGTNLPPAIIADGPFNIIKTGLIRPLGNSEQFASIKDWLGCAYGSVYDQRFPSFNRTLVLITDSLEEGEKFQGILTFLLGGRSIDPFHFTNRPGVNLAHARLAEAIHWAASKGLKDAERYRAFILANEIFSVGKSTGIHVSIPYGAHKSILVENTATELKKLPPLCFGLSEKVHVLVLQLTGDYQFDFKAAEAELEPFIHHILDSTTDAKSKGYMAPTTKELLFNASLAGELYRALCGTNISPGSIKSEVEIGNIIGTSLRDRKNWEKEPTSALMEIIAKHKPEHVQKAGNNWKLTLPQQHDDNEQSIGNDNDQ